MNTSLAAQGALAHRLQRRPRPIHKNAKSGAHPCSLPLGFNMAGWDLGGGGQKQKKSKTVFKCTETKLKKNCPPPPVFTESGPVKSLMLKTYSRTGTFLVST